MPRLDNMESTKLPTGNYGFSAQRIEDLGASEYTLVTLAVDDSSSVQPFLQEMQRCVRESVNACKYSPRADNLMIRVVVFGSAFSEFHGFKMLSAINLDDYNSMLGGGGMTSLYDAIENSVQATGTYSKKLVENDFSTNGIIIVITDGEENHSKTTLTNVKQAFHDVMRNEELESLVSILVGVNGSQPDLSQYLETLKNTVGFTQYVEISNANTKSLAKLAAFVSRSISAQSQALGTGGPSKTLSF